MNIGRRERRDRLLIGILLLGMSVASLAALVQLCVPPVTRLLLVVPWWMAIVGLVQAHQKT